jgi:hypothetical protein
MGNLISIRRLISGSKKNERAKKGSYVNARITILIVGGNP